MILLHNVYGQVVFISIQYSMHQFTYNNIYFSCTHHNCHKCTCIYGTGGESTSHHVLFRQELEISARKGSTFRYILQLCSHTTLSLGRVQYTDCITIVVELYIIFVIMYLDSCIVNTLVYLVFARDISRVLSFLCLSVYLKLCKHFLFTVQ